MSFRAGEPEGPPDATAERRHPDERALTPLPAEPIQLLDSDSSADLAAIANISHVTKLVGTYLQSKSGEWHVRDAALQRLASIVQDGALNPDASDFAPQLKAAVAAIVLQLPDLRSQVARSACTTMTVLTAYVGDHPALDRPMRDAVVPTLLTMSGNGNKVLAGAARECLPQLLEHSHFDGVLKVCTLPSCPLRGCPVAHSSPITPFGPRGRCLQPPSRSPSRGQFGSCAAHASSTPSNTGQSRY
tara:strand:+ start:78 stop:812 length:735 start_codon:yes stop_codon:yes gene_type:complete